MTRSLIIAPQWIGDAVMSEPLLADLAARGETLAVAALPWVAPVYRAMPKVREVIELPFAHGRLDWAARRRIAATLRDRFDAAYVLPNSIKAALIPWFAGIPRRVGYRGEGRWLLLNRQLPNPAGRPVEGNLLRPGWESFVGAGPLPMRHGLTMGELGRRSGVSKANIYRYFESREEVLLQLLVVELGAFVVSLERSLPATVDQLDAVADRLARGYLARPLLCQLLSMMSAVLEHNVSAPALARAKDQLTEFSARLAAALAQARVLGPELDLRDRIVRAALGDANRSRGRSVALERAPAP